MISRNLRRPLQNLEAPAPPNPKKRRSLFPILEPSLRFYRHKMDYIEYQTFSTIFLYLYNSRNPEYSLLRLFPHTHSSHQLFASPLHVDISEPKRAPKRALEI